jgi:hypothetical protein
MIYADFAELSAPPCGASHFLLLRQKKVSKEKATLGRRRELTPIRRSLALLGTPGGGLKLACGSNIARRRPPASCVAQRLPRGPVRCPGLEWGMLFQRFYPVDRKSQFFVRQLNAGRFWGPIWSVEQSAQPTAQPGAILST